MPDDSVLKNICSKDIAASEGLRLQMNRKLGLNVTKGQWKQTLQRVHHHFFTTLFFGHVDRRDVNELISCDFWWIDKPYNVPTEIGSMFWFRFKIREEDSTCMRWIKIIWLFTGFPILAIVQSCLVVMVISFLPFWPGLLLRFYGWSEHEIHLRQPEEAAEVALYGRDGVEVTGHVSDRWVTHDPDVSYFEKDGTMRILTTRNVEMTYFEKDGTMCNHMTCSDGYEDSVPMLFLPDRPRSGIPTRIIQARSARLEELISAKQTELVHSFRLPQ